MGRAKYLEVKAGEKKAWVDHVLENIIVEGLVGARLTIYIQAVRYGGTLKVYPARALNHFENQMPY